ncbi:MAG: excinuclease ABC subunit UvrB [Thermoguttaceae bacterium]
MVFQLVSHHQPAGDQPQAIASLVQGLREGKQHQVLQGVTGSGKTFSMANVIQAAQRPTLVISHNKTLANQLYREFQEFFPLNTVELFHSDYDFFQPQVYNPRHDRYIDKRAAIDSRITRHRIAAVTAAISRRDLIVVSTVSCLFHIGSPKVFREMAVSLAIGQAVDPDEMVARLARLGYGQVDESSVPTTFRAGAAYIEVVSSLGKFGYRIEFQDGRVNRLLVIDPQSRDPLHERDHVLVYPARLRVLPEGRIKDAIEEILSELEQRLEQFKSQGMWLEAQRLEAVTLADVEMLLTKEYCPGMEDYCRPLNRRQPGAPPDTLLDYFPKDFLTFVDESHATIPQIRGKHSGDHRRMQNLVEHGFRLPSAMDFRPLTFHEWEQRVGQVVFVSATPGKHELKKVSDHIVRQVIRPTGLLDPAIEILPSGNQMARLLREIRERTEVGERVLVTTITKRQAEELADHLSTEDIRCKWLHSGLNTRRRIEVLRDLRRGEFDVLVGVNLLREGLDLPEVSLVAILDADKAGFLRSETSLLQTSGRAARNVNAKAIFFANKVTDAMVRAIDQSRNRRQIQEAYNQKHGITPTTVFSSRLGCSG